MNTTIETATLGELIIDYQLFLNENLKGDDITEIAFRLKKFPKTISNYLKEGGAKEYLTMREVVRLGVELLTKKGITKNK